jgi:MFS family permease
MADLTPPEHRMRAMGLIGAAFGMGFVLGPAIGGMLSIYGMETAPLAAAVLTGLNGIAAFFLLAETMHTPMFMPVHHPLSWQLWFKVRRVPAAMAVCILMGLFVLFFSGFEVTLPLWGAEYLHWSMTSAGWTFAYVGVIMVIVQGVVIRRLTGRLGEKKAAQIGLLSTAFGLVLLPLADMLSPHAIYLPLGMVAVGAGLVHPSLSSLVSINTESYRQGLMMGLFQSMSALGRVLGPVAAGLAYSVWHKMIFLVIGLAILIVTVSFFTVCQRVQDAQHQ